MESGSLAPVAAKSLGALTLKSDDRDPKKVKAIKGDLGPYAPIGWQKMGDIAGEWLVSANYYYDDKVGDGKVGPFKVKGGRAKEGMMLPPLTGVMKQGEKGRMVLLPYNNYGSYSLGTALGRVEMSVQRTQAEGWVLTVEEVTQQAFLPIEILQKTVFGGQRAIESGFIGK